MILKNALTVGGKHGKYKSIRPLLTKYCKLYADVVFHLKSQFSSSSIYISAKVYLQQN